MLLWKPSVFQGESYINHSNWPPTPPKQKENKPKKLLSILNWFTSGNKILHSFIHFLCSLSPALGAVEVCQQYLSNTHCHNIYKNGNSPKKKKSVCVQRWHCSQRSTSFNDQQQPKVTEELSVNARYMEPLISRDTPLKCLLKQGQPPSPFPTHTHSHTPARGLSW